jgi:hypothetical protein
MSFDLASAQPVDDAPTKGKFDLASAKPVDDTPAKKSAPRLSQAEYMKKAEEAKENSGQSGLSMYHDALNDQILKKKEDAIGLVETPVAAATGSAGTLLGAWADVFTGGRSGIGDKVQDELSYRPRTEMGQNLTKKLGDVMGSDAVQGFVGGIPALGPEVAGTASALRNMKPYAYPAIAKAGQTADAIGSGLNKGLALVDKGVDKAAKAPVVGPVVRGLDKAAETGNAALRAAAEVPEKIKMAVKADPEAVKLAQKAQSYGIPVRPDMIYNNKIAKMMGEALEKVPLSGSKEGARQTAFNQALIKQIGGDSKAERLTPDVFKAAMDKSGGLIGDIGMDHNVKFGADAKSELDGYLGDVKKYQTADVGRIVNNYAKEIKGAIKNGSIDGETFKNFDSMLGRQIRASGGNTELRSALSDLQDMLQDAKEKSLPADKVGAYKEAKMQYAKGKTIEPLVAKSDTGDISGPGLMGRVTANDAGKARMARGEGGDLGDLARIGQRIMKPPPSSGTAERMAAYGLLGGGTAINPATAGGVWGAANLYNRLGPYMIPKPPIGQ